MKGIAICLNALLIMTGLKTGDRLFLYSRAGTRRQTYDSEGRVMELRA